MKYSQKLLKKVKNLALKESPHDILKTVCSKHEIPRLRLLYQEFRYSMTFTIDVYNTYDCQKVRNCIHEDEMHFLQILQVYSILPLHFLKFGLQCEIQPSVSLTTLCLS